MNNIDIGKLQEFIDDNQTKEMTIQETMKLKNEINLKILMQAAEELEKAYKGKNSAMVFAIAEILKLINL